MNIKNKKRRKITLKQCAICGRSGPIKMDHETLGKICHHCYYYNKHLFCTRCGKVDELFQPDYVCWECHQKDPSNHERCIKCGKVKPVEMREYGKPVCSEYAYPV